MDRFQDDLTWPIFDKVIHDSFDVEPSHTDIILVDEFVVSEVPIHLPLPKYFHDISKGDEVFPKVVLEDLENY